MYGHCRVVIWTVAVQLGDPGPDTVLPDPSLWQQLQRGGELGTVTDDGAIVITHTAIVPRTSQLIWNIF